MYLLSLPMTETWEKLPCWWLEKRFENQAIRGAVGLFPVSVSALHIMWACPSLHPPCLPCKVPFPLTMYYLQLRSALGPVLPRVPRLWAGQGAAGDGASPELAQAEGPADRPDKINAQWAHTAAWPSAGAVISIFSFYLTIDFHTTWKNLIRLQLFN